MEARSMTTHVLYDTTAQAVHHRLPGPYIVDGKPGTLPAHIVQLTAQDDPRPEHDPRKQRATRTDWYVDGDEYRRSWTLTDIPLAEVQARQIERVDTEVRERIEAIAPPATQMRMLARAVLITRKSSKGRSSAAEEDEADQLEALETGTLQPIRDHGKTLKAAISDAGSVDDVLRVDLTAGWPA